jgi:hypothetical protein
MLKRPQLRTTQTLRNGVLVAYAALTLLGAGGVSGQQQDGSRPTSAAMAGEYGALPLSFEVNKGQSDERVKFMARGKGYGLFLTAQEAVLSLHGGRPKDFLRRLIQNPVRQGISTHGNGSFARPVTFAEGGEPTNAGGDRDVLRLQLEHATPRTQPVGFDELPGVANYFIGNDPAAWHSNIATYSKVRYASVYKGVDLVYYGTQGQLEYDFVVAPGASASPIHMHFDGAKTLALTAAGDLTIAADHGSVIFKRPVVYQTINGRRTAVDGRFKLLAGNTIGFSVGRYDHGHPLVIDPVLAYSTYFGGTTVDFVTSVAAGSDGSAYVTGLTLSEDFPLTSGAFQAINYASNANDVTTAFISKFNPSGTALLYSTYIGGNAVSGTLYNQGDYGKSIAVDSSGDAFVAGYTYSVNFPVTNGAYQTGARQQAHSATGFVTKLNPAGTGLIYSTYLGGNIFDEPTAMTIDSAGNAYISGVTYSTDFPTTSGVIQTVNKSANTSNTNQFVSKLNPTGTALVYSTYLGGGSNVNSPIGDLFYTNPIVVDSSGNAYVAAFTSSGNFPVTAGAYQTTNHGGFSATLSKLNPTATALIYSTYLGGSADTYSQGLAVDASGNAYVGGFTSSTDFPVTSGAFQTTNKATVYTSNNGNNPSDTNGFVTKINPTGSALIYSTYLGGTAGPWGGDQVYSLALDSAGDVYVAGSVTSDDFPVTSNAFQSTNKGATHCCDYTTYDTNAFLAEFNPSGTALLYSTYFGGSGQQNPEGAGPVNGDGADDIALSSTGELFMVGFTGSSNFPTTADAFDTVYHSAQNMGFVAAFNFGTPVSTAATSTTLVASGNPVVPGTSVTFTATVAPVSGSGTPTGTVTFSVDEAAVATVTLASGKATYTTSTLTAGEHYVLATYSGSSTYAGSGGGFNEVIQPKTPVITPAAGTYNSEQTVTITSPTAGGVIYYTLDGTTPTVFSTLYTGPLMLTTSKTVTAVAVATQDADSVVATSAINVIGSPSVLGSAATPVASTTATLNAFVNSLGLTGTYIFHYGSSATALSSATTATALTAAATRVAATANITGLASGKTYYFQVTATTAGGVTNGPILSFTTQ